MTSSFPNLTTLSPISLKTFSRLASSSWCRSWISPSTSTTSADLSKTPCDLYGVTVKINNESRDDLLPPKMDSQFIRTQFLPQNLFGRRHLAAEFFCTLKFFLGDFLTGDDVFDRHGNISLVCSGKRYISQLTNPSPVSPEGEKPKPS